MPNPQQPELRRSGLGEVVESAAKSRHGGPSDEEGPTGPVPEANAPGHRPEHDQDKPEWVPEAYRADD